jgi:hypothetical protein
MGSDGDSADEAEQHGARAMLKKEFSSRSLSLRQQSFRRSSVGSDWSEDDSASVSDWGGGETRERSTVLNPIQGLRGASVLGKNLSEKLAERRAIRALGTRLSKMAVPEHPPETSNDASDPTGRSIDGPRKPGSGVTAEMRRRFKAVADAAAFASYVRKQVAKRRAAKEMLARLIQDEPAMRSACEDAFEAPETIDDEQDTRGFEDVVVDRRVSVPESVAVSLPSLKEGDEEAVEEAVADENNDENENGVDVQPAATSGRRRRRGSTIDYDKFRQPKPAPPIATSLHDGDTFRWRPATRVTVAVDLPPELFQDDDENYDEAVLLAGRTLRESAIASTDAAANAAAPAANARDALRQQVKAARRRGEETAMDEETAVRIASDRVVAAAKLSKSYDANVRTARSRADLAKPKPAPKRPIYTSKTVVSRAKPSANARKNAEHYGKWFLTPELKARSRYERDKDAYELLVGGESAAIERELRVREVELGRQLEGSFGAKAYKRYVESNHSIGSGSLPGYLKSVEAAADDGSATAVTRARTVRRREASPPLGELPFATVGAVHADSPAERAGLKTGDRLVSFGGLVGKFRRVTTQMFGPLGLLEQKRRADGTFAGEPATVWLMRDAKLRKIDVTPGRWREGDAVDLLGCELEPTPEGADGGADTAGGGADTAVDVEISSRSSGFEFPRLDDAGGGETLVAGLRPM